MKGITRFFLRERLGRFTLVFAFSIFFIYLFSSPAKPETGGCILPDGQISVLEKKYAVVIDAGSTGSRVHVYHFDFCGERHPVSINHELFVQTKPGLSSYDNPEDAANSLEPLLQESLSSVPANARSCTPIALKATAGLRLLEPKGLANQILDAVERRLRRYPFPLAGAGDPKSPAVSIIDGSEEGVFAWVALNFLVKTMGSKRETFASLDLGGGSTQIVFDHPGLSAQLHKDYLYPFSFGASAYSLYQHSYLGFGLMEARKKIKAAHLAHDSAFPCFPKGFADSGLTGGWLGFDSCSALARSVFGFEAVCSVSPCAFSGVYHPDIHPAQKIYAFSYFQEVLESFGFASEFTLAEMKRKVDDVCTRQSGTYPAVVENPHLCLDAVYIYILLKDGYRISPDRIINTAKKIDGYETSWTLGAAIDMLGLSKLKCSR
eukprot:TRINITY_DN1740_c0_g1_i1.p1 TRINITY_DN1740_c0_g1~~TRINITY_DN1740_c0_g1_i1.p1  ORF type:complete len:450 (-),score=149.39 TRINITY_DN1740_c0_g1_i1:83-1384(-)